jgi:hypothetical protein
MTQPRMPKTAPPLSRRLEAAFARLDPATPVPPWPRSVRIGVDYSLRVTGMNPATDREADSLAYACFVLGNLGERDPPATVTAQERAQRAGADCARAFDLLAQIRDGSAEWARRGWAVPTLAITPCGSCSGRPAASGSARQSSPPSSKQPNMSRVSSAVVYLRPTR